MINPFFKINLILCIIFFSILIVLSGKTFGFDCSSVQKYSMIWNYNSINKFITYFKSNNDINGPFDTVLDVFSLENDNFNIYWSEKTLFVQGSIKNKFNSHLR